MASAPGMAANHPHYQSVWRTWHPPFPVGKPAAFAGILPQQIAALRKDQTIYLI